MRREQGGSRQRFVLARELPHDLAIALIEEASSKALLASDDTVLRRRPQRQAHAPRDGERCGALRPVRRRSD
jgi:hypothetical protein